MLKQWDIRRYLTVFLYFFKVFGPVILVVGGGVLFFLEPVANSISSTPHPSLVYTIFAMFIGAIGLIAAAFIHYVREESLAIKLLSNPAIDSRVQVLDSLRWKTDMRPVYNLLIKSSFLPLRMKQAAIESELFAGPRSWCISRQGYLAWEDAGAHHNPHPRSPMPYLPR